MIVVAFNELHGGNSQRGSLVEVAAVWEGFFLGGEGLLLLRAGAQPIVEASVVSGFLKI